MEGLRTGNVPRSAVPSFLWSCGIRTFPTLSFKAVSPTNRKQSSSVQKLIRKLTFLNIVIEIEVNLNWRNVLPIVIVVLGVST